jgi:hypothetical protein
MPSEVRAPSHRKGLPNNVMDRSKNAAGAQWSDVELLENSNLQRRRRQWSPTGAPALARRIQARFRVPSGVERRRRKFPEAALREAGYGAVWHGQKSWNGVALLARGLEPVESRRESKMPGRAMRGLRTDHLLLNPSITARLVSAGSVVKSAAAKRRAIHAPTWGEIADS